MTLARAWRLTLALSCLAGIPVAQAQLVSSPRPFDVMHYAARIEPDLAQQSLQGQATLQVRMTRAGIRTIALDRGDIAIDSARERGRELEYTIDGKRLRLTFARPSRAGERRVFQLRYHAAPKFGLEFHPEREQIYTIFSTSQWLPSIDAPDERATLDLEVILPQGLAAVGSGRAQPPQRQQDGRMLHRWRQRVPVPAYAYGFAAGRFTEVVQRDRGSQRRYLADGFDADQLRRMFADTGEMLAFFAAKAGVRYSGDAYTQALVAETIGQEHAGFALMSEQYGRDVLAMPDNVALIAHEAAHQWWGNRVTCSSWNHFWLNEGFANFMAAAYLEHRYGRAAYERQVEGWRKRVERLRNEGKNKPLVFPEWNHPSADDRAVVYQKGAYMLHLLRGRMGDAAFWRGVRDYTRAHIDGTVETRDFEQAMQRHSRDDLA
ncbi:MAG TPA: M1 family metallopeptidase, partial [Lysobacter sp.]|nr:M1 family metallopeptidase [Lysobacter sp.]